ncbi:MAG: hypothetical protein J6M05_00075 [Cardiobacteriaceae bacterium]|nr:hypothetical protein [Cardiobacteriaceae bacterium]
MRDDDYKEDYEDAESDGWEDEEDDVKELGGSGTWGEGFGGGRYNDDGDDSGWEYDDNDDDDNYSDGYSDVDRDDE